MVRKVDETHREFKARMIDPVSDSFCGAKWYNATIWLGHGGTTSCHHPPAHQIDLEDIKENPSAIHNSRHKKKMRQMMQEGTVQKSVSTVGRLKTWAKTQTAMKLYPTEYIKQLYMKTETCNTLQP